VVDQVLTETSIFLVNIFLSLSTHIMTLVFILGILIGAVMGLTGAGGGILAVPVLVSGMHLSMQQAAPIALIAVASGAAVGAADGFKHGLVRYKAAILMAVCGIPMTRLGQYWAHLLPQFILMGVFSTIMVVVSWRFYKQSQLSLSSVSEDQLRLAFISGDTGRFIWTPIAAVILCAIGMLTGLMTGLLGVGGGFLIVPLMRRFTHLALPGIVATSLFLITLVGTGGVINSLLSGAQLPVFETIGFVSSMICGMLIGRRLSRKLPAWQIQRGFSLLLLFVSLNMMYRAYEIF
jgi:uncharacterized membrane protein YfcA